jgi:uncharacterized iron-regulated membrane protein
MVSAYIWHWWLGVIFVLALILTVVGLVGGYLKQVTSQQYPGRRARRGGDPD